jgi:hypothetical protein
MAALAAAEALSALLAVARYIDFIIALPLAKQCLIFVHMAGHLASNSGDVVPELQTS